MLIEFYEKNYKKLLVIPALLIIFSLIIVVNKINSTGEIADRDVTLTGGLSATIFTDKEFDMGLLERELRSSLNEEVGIRRLEDFTSKRQIGFVVETSNPKIESELRENVEAILGIELGEDNYSVEEVGSGLGEAFYKGMLKAVLIAFILMGIVVFISFRSFIPSSAVILSAFLDIIGSLAVINLIGIKLSLGGIAALFLVIGYSVDTDILLTTRMLKGKEGSVIERIVSSFNTGITMTVASIAALGIGYFVTSSLLLKNMFLIIVIALFIDIISTYLMNAGILAWYIKRSEE